MKIVTRGDPVPQLISLNPPPSLKTKTYKDCSVLNLGSIIPLLPTEKQIHTKRHTVHNIMTVNLQGIGYLPSGFLSDHGMTPPR